MGLKIVCCYTDCMFQLKFTSKQMEKLSSKAEKDQKVNNECIIDSCFIICIILIIIAICFIKFLSTAGSLPIGYHL